ncbi:hypothetical protein [Neobacillus dielmonensis]|uniref:hypothetical protein n=1 Tax=Neobacillus dielmonensis TaxID=1347369 RepID=UPI0005A9F761|nr:hypothetical protein [Neobacillus dielmonensis]
MGFALVRLMAILLCGYCLATWLTIQHPFYLTDFILQVILQPLEFFASTVVLCAGVQMNGSLLRELIQKPKGIRAIGHMIGILLVFSILFHLSWIHSLILFCLSLIYVIISVRR